MKSQLRRIERAGEADVGASLSGEECREVMTEISRLTAALDTAEARVEALMLAAEGESNLAGRLDDAEAALDRQRAVIEAARKYTAMWDRLYWDGADEASRVIRAAVRALDAEP